MFEPAGRARFAGFVWIAVAVMLFARAYPYFQQVLELNGTGAAAGVVVAALVVGAAKGLFVLRKSCRRLVTRIQSKPGKQGVWTIWPPVFLVLIALMIGFGVGLRHYAGANHPWVVVLVYFGVGAALAVSSLHFFKAASRLAAGEEPFPAAAAPEPAAAE